METITIDGVDEHAFRHSVEDMLRLGDVDAAVADLRTLVAPYAGTILPRRFAEVSAADLEITGWDRIGQRLNHHHRSGYPITAIGVVLADARVLGGPGPQGGRLAPFLKTYYFSDDAYPFTNAAREDLLDGYSREGFGWQGDYQATDATIGIKGIDDLHGALIELEDRLLDSSNPPEDHLRAGTIGACYLAALIHQALRDTIRREGMPRPLCVLAACDGIYPFFDAPVAGWDEAAPALTPGLAGAWSEDAEDCAADEWGESSLLTLTVRKATKQLALAIGEEDALAAARYTEEASAQRLVVADERALRGLFHGRPAATPEELAAYTAEIQEPEETFADFAAGEVEEPDASPAVEGTGSTPEQALPENPVAAYYAEARAEFRRAEEAQAFPTGRALRQRLQVVEAEPSAPIGARLRAAAARLFAMLRRHVRLRLRHLRFGLRRRLARVDLRQRMVTLWQRMTAPLRALTQIPARLAALWHKARARRSS